MNINLLVVGKTNEAYLNQGIEIYNERLRHYVNFAIDTITPPKELRTLSPQLVKEREGELILKRASHSDRLILLDEHGMQYSSVKFADYIERQMNVGYKQLTFVIGGAFGFSQQVYEKADGKISLSTMTFNHQMVRLFFVEQLYRAFTIIRHEKYHNE